MCIITGVRKCHSTILYCYNGRCITKYQCFGHNITEYEDLVNENTDLRLGEECIQGIGKVFIAEGLPHLGSYTHAILYSAIMRRGKLTAIRQYFTYQYLFAT